MNAGPPIPGPPIPGGTQVDEPVKLLSDEGARKCSERSGCSCGVRFGTEETSLIPHQPEEVLRYRGVDPGNRV